MFFPELTKSLEDDPRSTGLTKPFTDAQLIDAVNRSLSVLPGSMEVPSFINVQRIFNKACIECHGGLNYPPYVDYGTLLNLSEDKNPPLGKRRLDRSHDLASLLGSEIYRESPNRQKTVPTGSCLVEAPS